MADGQRIRAWDGEWLTAEVFEVRHLAIVWHEAAQHNASIAALLPRVDTCSMNNDVPLVDACVAAAGGAERGLSEVLQQATTFIG